MYASGRKEPQRAVEGELAQPLRIHPSRGKKDQEAKTMSQRGTSRRSTIEECGERNRGWGIQLNFKNKRSGHGGGV